ncbi:hypothetical protein GGI25_002328 [Coemansia spiralis]|uniref:DUF1909-domain-containing protein n=2 Tax=Coemansia TaxID=4863 RepID=A0A9W8KXM7_9FUNG|nr:At2g23090 like protein [Coemansia spiralis]KAJ1989568.1 hypothetical protein EDC05_004602 [Coemansia umbellata]KAJ2625716.1 hypothetical protein GGI26_000516 [Coemansia sp. RSA 1358]KAJ2678534.1 hypothetical protein GGI25_002328 [Coemansia spiralis]
MGNGAKAQQKRERKNAATSKGAKSQLKVNEQAKNIICNVCKTTFLCTSREKQLAEHAENKHSKSVAECFPNYVPPLPAK